MIGYHVDALRHSVTRIEYEYGDLSRYLPGGLAIAQHYDNGDVLYADDEGMMHKIDRAFILKSRPNQQPLVSDAILTGPDHFDNATGDETTLAPRTTIDELLADIEFITVEQALDWFRLRSLQPAMQVTVLGEGTHTIATWGDFIGTMEGK